MMKHQEIKELLPLYVDGGLDPDEVGLVEAHLAECEECRSELVSYEENYTFLAQINDVEVSADFLASVMRRVEEERRQKVESAGELSGLAAESGRREEERERKVMALPESRRSKAGQNQENSRWWGRLTDLLQRRMRIPVGVMGVIAAAVVLLILIGPSGLLPYGNRGGQFELQNYGMQQEIQQDLAVPESTAPRMEMRSLAKSEATQRDQFIAPKPQTGAAPLPVNVERKVIKTANLRVEVKDIEAAQQKVIAVTEELKGFVASSNNWVAGNDQNFSSYQLRIPSEKFYAALESLGDLGKVLQRSLGGQDVTEEYVDIQSRLKNLKLQEDRYRDLLQRAQDVEDILAIERELERIRSSIESLQGQINYFDNQTSMSTIDIELAEPLPLGSSDWGIMNVLRQAFRAMATTFFTILVRLGQYLPYLVLILLGYGVYRMVRRKK